MSEKSRALKQSLRDGKLLTCLLHGLASPQVAEMAALAGYDLAIIDAEHGPGNGLAYQAMLQAIAAGGGTSMIRIGGRDAATIGAALDLGPDAVMVPGIDTAEQARAVVDAARYPPAGRRGNGTLLARASGYGLCAREQFASGNPELVLAVMIESQLGARNAAEIAAVEGIDAIVVGVFDLTGDQGIAGQFEHPTFQAIMAGIERDVRAQGKALGTVVYPGTNLIQLVARGHRLITLGADTLLLGRAMREQLDGVSGMIGIKAGPDPRPSSSIG